MEGNNRQGGREMVLRKLDSGSPSTKKAQGLLCSLNMLLKPEQWFSLSKLEPGVPGELQKMREAEPGGEGQIGPRSRVS